MCVCVCVCVRARARAYVYVHVSVGWGERERGGRTRGRERERERGSDGSIERALLLESERFRNVFSCIECVLLYRGARSVAREREV